VARFGVYLLPAVPGRAALTLTITVHLLDKEVSAGAGGSSVELDANRTGLPLQVVSMRAPHCDDVGPR